MAIYNEAYLDHWAGVFIAHDLHGRFGIRFEQFVADPDRYLAAEMAFETLCELLEKIKSEAPPAAPWPETAIKRAGETGAGLMWYRGPRLANPLPRRLQATPAGSLRRVHGGRLAGGVA